MKKEAREGYKMTELGEIPNGWEVVKLKEIICEFVVPMRDKPKIFDGNIPWCRIEDIEGNYLHGNREGRLVSEKIIEEMNLKVLPKNSLIASCSATLGVYAINTIPLITNQTFIGLIPGEKVSVKYLLYYMNMASLRLKKNASGTTIPYISRESFEQFNIALPTIGEQEKIAEILSTVDEQIENTEKLIQKNQELKKGLMQQLLTKGIGHTEFKKTEIGSVPIEWKIKNLEYLVEIRNGNSPSNFTLNETGKYPFFKVDDMNYTNKYLNKAKVYFDDCKYSLMTKGMIVFPKRGASIFTNKIAILNFNGYFDTNIMGLKCKDELINEYLFYYLKFIRLERFADTTAVPQINNKHINPLKIPIPSIIEQEKIVWGLDQIDGKIEQYKNKKEKLEYLKGGLMQDLLLGKIRVI